MSDPRVDWTKLLQSEIEDAYRAADGLMALVDDLAWKPPTGENWMTTGQLLQHIPEACGMCIRGFVTGDWGMPEGMDPSEMPAEAMLPPAEAMQHAESVEAARKALADDKRVALAMMAEAGEERLTTEITTAPWDPREVPLGQRCLQMVGHLLTHKDQLFFYLKAQGKKVDTHHLYGMAG